MANPISGAAGGAGMSNVSSSARQLQQNQGDGQSFKQVLEQVGNKAQEQPQASAPEQSQPARSEEFERLRTGLMQRTEGLPSNSALQTELMRQMLSSRTDMSLMREALNRTGNSSQVTDLRGRMGQLENELNSIDAIWRSKKDLSPGELLALQARLYQVTQHVEVLSKVVDQMTGGIKTILNTNV
ncbi:MAG TPA: hypothetical protein VGB73_09940 [Pyrinomonadaceae bacterium]|jgi:hypothetical protein